MENTIIPFGFFALAAFVSVFVYREKKRIDAHYYIKSQRPEGGLIDSKDDAELNARINGYRERSSRGRLRPEPILKEIAYEHLQIMIAQNEAIEYNDETDGRSITKIHGIVSATKKTICSTFVGFEHNLKSLNKVLLEDINAVGSATQLHNGNYYTVTLFARFNPALDLP